MKIPTDTTRRLGLVLCPVALALAFAPVASADESAPVQVDTQKPIGPSSGDFSASGAITDAGEFSNTSAFFTAVPSPTHTNGHLSQLFVSDNGTFTMRVQIKETVTDDPSVFTGSGNWVLTKGTGAYEGLHGTGKVTGTVDDNTGLVDRTYTGKVH